MSLYFLLGTLTATGQQKVHDNREMFMESTRRLKVDGAEIYDFVMMVEADDNDAVARLSLELGVLIGLHIETLPAIAIGFLTERMQDDPAGRPTSVQLRPDQ